MWKAIVTALMLLVAAPAAANTVRITGIDPGGSIETYSMWYERMQTAQDTLVIDGVCVSACTIFLHYLPPEDVCMTDRAVLGVHMTSGNEPHNEDMTELFVRQFYPQWMQDMIVARGGLEEWPIFLNAEDLVPHIQMCPGYQVPTKRTFVAEGDVERNPVSIQELPQSENLQ